MSETAAADPYASHQALYNRVPVPDHVPDDRVVEFDYIHPAGIEEGDVYTACRRSLDRHARRGRPLRPGKL